MTSSKAIVLSREPFGEADLYVQFLTKKWGVITTLAKSARKSKRRYVGGLDIFCHDEIFLRGVPKERAYLNELVVLNAFTGIRDDLDKVMVAGKAVQWIRKLADIASPMPGVYSLLGQTLSLIEKEGDPVRLELLGLVFKLKLLSQLGLKPRLDACVRCGQTTPADAVFDMEAGGLLCRACASKSGSSVERLRLGLDERAFLDVADRFRLTAWDDITFPKDRGHQLSRLVTRFASFHTHVRLPV